MKVIYWENLYTKDSPKGVTWGWKKEEVKSIEVLRVDFCCAGMEEAWEELFIGFGDGWHGSAEVELKRWHEGDLWSSVPIRYCPVCAEPIAVEQQEGEA